MDRHLSEQLHAVLQRLDLDLDEVKIHCPLCRASLPIRGLRPHPKNPGGEVNWQLVFSCPSCGLMTAFSATDFSARRLRAAQGSAWAREIRDYSQMTATEALISRAPATRSHFIAVFVISFLTWFVLAGGFDLLILAWGVIVSLVVARFSYEFVRFDLPRWIWSPRRWLYFFDVMLEFTRQLVLQNVTLSIRVLRPGMPIKPGIVAIRTTLHDEAALTVLGSLMSLTPDTVTIDIDQEKGLIYVHWIDVTTTDPEEARKLISASLEEKIIRWLQ